MAPQTALDVKQAVSTACAYLSDLFPAGDTLLLEEVEVLEDGGWSVTLSYESPIPDPYGLNPSQFHSVVGGKRVYKVITLDASGTPLSVKMR